MPYCFKVSSFGVAVNSTEYRRIPKSKVLLGMAQFSNAFRDSIAVAADFPSQMSAVVNFGHGLLRTQPADVTIDLLR